MRLIDADKFVEYIDAGHLRSGEDLCFSENDVVDMIDKQPTVNQWIPCSERLPEFDTKVMVTLKNEDFYCTDIITFTKDLQNDVIGWVSRNTGQWKVLAWMPLPEPYRGDEE